MSQPNNHDRVVVIGGGLAAASCAETLRDEGWQGAIDIVAAEEHPPHERPPLSKGVLLGDDPLDVVFPHPQDWYDEHGVTLRMGRRATGLDTEQRVVTVDDGTDLAYDSLMLATGAQPRPLDLPGAGVAGVHYLRTIDDNTALRAALRPGDKRVVIAGAGWIGLEVAAAARTLGNAVTVVAPDQVPLARAVGERVGAVFQARHAAYGVSFRLGESIVGLDIDAGRLRAVRTEAAQLPADVLVVGIGVLPDDVLARNAGLSVDNGIVVDAGLRADAPGVYAAGDVANAWHPWLATRLRSEHWANALEGGKVAARNMLGQGAEHDGVPYFFTDQYDLGMEFAGFGPLLEHAELVFRGDPETGEFIAFWRHDGYLVAGMNVNIWDVSSAIQSLITRRVPVDAAVLSDPSTDLSELAGG